MSKIKILLNGEEYLIKKDQNILDLVKELNLDINKIAIEKNLEIILSENFNEVSLSENDQIEVVAFIGGG